METVVLNVESRSGKGKGEAGRLRRDGKIPAVFYGPGKNGAPILFDAREFRLKMVGHEGAPLIQLLSASAEVNEKMVLLKDVQRHPVTNALIHIDFYEIDVNKPIQITVPLHFVGKAQGVTAGGILQPLRREVMVECLPREIPPFLEVDVTALGIHDSVHIEDLTLPAGTKAVFDINEPLVTVAPPTVISVPTEEVEQPVEGAPPEEGAPEEQEEASSS